ncbi:MAG: DUF4445 domain-containing protein [Chloroflexi bacterium]|nr:DUF4445 domain-containing protein [Chloroflexota bacterium]
MARPKPKEQVRVHFKPDNVDVIAERGENLLQVAIAAGVHIYASCGGAGTCGTCKVLVEKGEVETTRTKRLTEKEYKQGIRQACQSRILSDLDVYVPVESRLEKAVLTRESKQVSEVLATGWRFKPPLTKYYLELPPPTSADNTSDLSRLLRGLKQRYDLSNIVVDFGVVRKMAEVLRQGDWKVTATTLVTAARPRAGDARRPRLINIEPGDTRQRHYSLAIDIGTTTVVGQLLDLNRGRVLADAIQFNKQISYGQDVISRINYCQKPGGLETLQQAVVKTVNEVIAELLAHARVEPDDIEHIMAAGNTTMTQILLGLDPKYIRLAPYTPVANFFPAIPAGALGIDVPDHVYLYTFPAVSSYVGGDIVSGIIGAGIHQRSNLTFYIDIGTNGEIVIGNSDWMVTSSCSAGPAFEGGGIRHGIVAIDGAIEEVNIDPSTLAPAIGTIGGSRPRGICGSGLINLTASLLENNIISPNGKFNRELGSDRIRPGTDGYEYVLAWAPETQIEKDIVVTEVDIDNLMRAKAAMYAGFQTLSKSVGVKPADYDMVIIAGAFGSHLNVAKSITIGLLPDLPPDKFIFIGNGSLLGARLTSYSVDLLDDARRVARMMTNIELSENTDFMDGYIASLFLPHTHTDEFPTVSKRLAGRPGPRTEVVQ